MSEPQDHRLDLPWQLQQGARDGAIWTEPAIPGAAPVHVATVETTVDALTTYLVGLHNAALTERSHLPEVGIAAEYWLKEVWGNAGTSELSTTNLRDAFVDGYRDGWKASTSIGQQEARDQGHRITRLSDQLAAAELRAEAMVATIQQLQKERNEALTLANEARNMEQARDRVMGDNALLRSQVGELRANYDDMRAAWTVAQEAGRTHLATAEGLGRELHAAKLRVEEQDEELSDLRDVADDARIVASLSTSPGARSAAMERIRRQSPAVQDFMVDALPPTTPEEGASLVERAPFGELLPKEGLPEGRETELGDRFRLTLDPGEVLNGNTDPAVWASQFMMRFQDTQADEGTMRSWFAHAIETGVSWKRSAGAQEMENQPFYPPNAQGGYPSAPTGDALLPGLYDKGKPLFGVGHHTPSYAEGYRIGREDTSNAFREPMNQRDQALYAAHLLLAESVAAQERTRTQWQRAVRRWQDEYVVAFGDGDQA